MANTAVSHIKLNNYKPSWDGSLLESTEEIGIPLDGALFVVVSSEDPLAALGINSKILYPAQPNSPIYFTNETVAQLVAQANGNISAS